MTKRPRAPIVNNQDKPWHSLECAIPDQPDFTINIHGEVRNRHTGRLRTPSLCGKTMTLRLRGKGYSLPRLVLTVFSPIEFSDKCFAAYKDGNPHNNHLNNLEWRYKGLFFSHLTLQDITDIRARWQTTNESYATIAKDYNASLHSIGAIIRGEYWSVVS